jgi:biopolymer transport protein ExbB
MKKKTSFSSIFAGSAMLVCLIVSVLLYMLVLGNPANFEGGDPANSPLPGNYFGMVYHGGFVVPILMSLFLMAIVFSIERFFSIRSAHGKGSIPAFVAKVKAHLEYDDLDEAVKECDKQKGSIGNVIKSSLLKMDQMRRDTHLTPDQKLLSIEKELEDSISLEMPMLNRNLPVLATLASIATLIGLFGTVLGMIRAFAALSVSGNPDSTALAMGISEALINTALGIGTSAIAIVFYNYFTNKIDTLRYSIDEIGLSIIQNFHAKLAGAPTAHRTATVATPVAATTTKGTTTAAH